MKKTAGIIALSAGLFLVNCNRNEVARYAQQKDSLMAVLDERESELTSRETSLDEFITSFNEVERNLDSIAVKQKIITMDAARSRGEFRASQKERINEQISAINEWMETNRKTVADLRRKLKGSTAKNAKLQESIELLNEQLLRKDEELIALNEKLNAMNLRVARLETSVDSLSNQNLAKEKAIEENLSTIHTAYYLVGKPKDLRDAKVTDKAGGLLGMGKTTKLKENFDKGRFTMIDYTKTDKIPVNSEKIKIVTNHPTDSYKLETDAKDKDIVRTLVITNAEKFWSVSKFLVVEGTPTPVDKSISSTEKNPGGGY